MKQKKSSTLIQISLIVLITFSCNAFAESSWLQKGTDFFKSLGGKKELTIEEIGAGLKEALKVGSENVVKQLGTTNGFNNDANIHIPLPAVLEKVKEILSKVGMPHLFEDLELKLNRAAEAATPKAKQLFSQPHTRTLLIIH